MAYQGISLQDPQLDRSRMVELKVYFKIVAGAVTLDEGLEPSPALISKGAISQADLSGLLRGAGLTTAETVTEFNLLKMDATAQGTDALGYVLRTSGQVKEVVSSLCEIYVASGSDGYGDSEPAAALVASTLAAGLELTVTEQAIAGRHIITGLDAVTTARGVITVRCRMV